MTALNGTPPGPPLTISTEHTPTTGVYRVRLDPPDGMGEGIHLTRAQATAWAIDVITAAAAADYDAAVLAQLTGHGGLVERPPVSALDVIQTLRDRRPAPAPAIPDLTALPQLDAYHRGPFVAVLHHGATLGRFTTPDARVHAVHIAHAAALAAYDTDYAATLTVLGVPPDTADAAVTALDALRTHPANPANPEEDQP